MFKKYWVFLATFVGITLIQSISVTARLCIEDPSPIQNIVVLLGLLITGWAGLISIRKLRVRLWHLSLLGFGLSFGTHWALPIFHKGMDILNLFFINSIIMAVTTLLGGCLAFGFGWITRR